MLDEETKAKIEETAKEFKTAIIEVGFHENPPRLIVKFANGIQITIPREKNVE